MMGKQEFLGTLGSIGKVEFDNFSILNAENEVVGRALAADLEDIIFADNEVHYGIQTETPDRGFTGGTLRWAVVTDRALIATEARIEEEGKGEEKRPVLKCNHERLDLSDIRGIRLDRRYVGPRGLGRAIEASVSCDFASGEVKIESGTHVDIVAVREFLKAVLKARRAMERPLP